MKKLLCFMIAALLLLTAGCGKTEPAADPTDPVQPGETAPVDTGLTATPGETLTLNADGLSGEISWSSSNPAAAKVDQSGNVQALQSRGQVTITATAGDQEQKWEVSLCEKTEFGNVSLLSGDEKLSIGVWNGSYHVFDLEHMEYLSDAGIDLIIGINERWLDGTGMEGVLERAEEFGVSIIADLRDWDGESIPEYVDNPYLKGFLMFDEPCATDFETLAALQKKFNAVMPEDKMFFVNLFGAACAYEALFGEDYNPIKVDYEEFYLKYFTETVDAECISYDAYPLQEGGYIRSAYYYNFDVASHRAKELGTPFWYTLLSSGHNTTDGRYVTPTDRELRWQMAMAMTYGAENLTHYVYTTNEEGYVNMVSYGDFEPTAIYEDVKTVNLEFRAWEDIYMSYEWVGTARVEADKENALMDKLEYDISFKKTGVLTGVESTENLLVGVFENNGSNAYMITNAGSTSDCDLWLRENFMMEDAQVTLQLKDGDYRCVAVIQGGQTTYVPVGADHTVSVTVNAFDGIFVIPVM